MAGAGCDVYARAPFSPDRDPRPEKRGRPRRPVYFVPEIRRHLEAAGATVRVHPYADTGGHPGALNDADGVVLSGSTAGSGHRDRPVRYQSAVRRRRPPRPGRPRGCRDRHRRRSDADRRRRHEDVATRHRDAPVWTVRYHPELTASLLPRIDANFGWPDDPDDRDFDGVTVDRTLRNFVRFAGEA